MNVFRRLRIWLRPLASRTTLEDEMQAEMRQHIARAVERLIARGLSPDDAQVAARREFGNRTEIEESARDARGMRWMVFSWIDVKVGLRRLRKHPALNLAAVFALAVGIPVGLAPSHLARALAAPLPGDTDHRLRAIRYWDPLSSGVAPTRGADFAFWARSLRGFSSLGAFRSVRHNVGPTEGRAAPAAGAQFTASVFPMLGARALLGRVLDDGDFVPNAPDVVVIGHSLWSSRFGKDPGVLGRSIRIGRNLHAVVGVMPDGFAFPVNETFWLPLRPTAVGASGPSVPLQILGRLADGVSARQAQAEVSAQGAPPIPAATTAEAQERARLLAEVVPFGLLYLGLPAGGMTSLPEYLYVQVLTFVLLLVACGNVAMLVLARTATRLQELVIRTALGASRSRLVSQVFVETLLLAVIAAGVGVLAVSWAMGHVNLAALAGESVLPYWLSLDLTPETALSAVVLAAVSATVAGVAPAIAITGPAIAQKIRRASRVRFGGLIGSLVVADIAVSVAAVGMAFATSRHATDLRVTDRATGIPASEYLAAEFRLPGNGGAPEEERPQLAAAQRALVAALEREPGIRRVAVGDALPRMDHRSRPFELDEAQSPDRLLRWTRLARVDVDFFDALGAPILAGRGFDGTDVEGGVRVAIVSRAFVDRAMGGGDPVGRRVRFPTQLGGGGSSDLEWFEIVGVVGPLGVNIVNAERGEAVYLPAAPGTINPMQVAIHASVPPASLTGRVRELAIATDPDLVMGRAAVLSDVRQGDWYLVMGLAAGLVVLVGVLIALATSGLYAMLSLSVSERTREIGIRAALGAPRPALLLTILRRSLVLIGLGAAIGLPLAARFVFELTGTAPGGGSAAQSTAVAVGLAMGIVVAVGVGSCLAPTRRILAIQAKEAMQAEG